ncbi:unnamed protein product, partial [Discosporangium mesarthrocarpum]
ELNYPLNQAPLGLRPRWQRYFRSVGMKHRPERCASRRRKTMWSLLVFLVLAHEALNGHKGYTRPVVIGAAAAEAVESQEWKDEAAEAAVDGGRGGLEYDLGKSYGLARQNEIPASVLRSVILGAEQGNRGELWLVN